MLGTIAAAEFTRKTVECNPNSFREIKELIDSKLADILKPESNIRDLAFTVIPSSSLLPKHFQIDMLAQEDAYVACGREMLPKITESPGPELTYNTRDCLYEYVRPDFLTFV